ncbi:MAG: hypothetical protein ACNA8H_13795 [Anaerolineales bacterium]
MNKWLWILVVIILLSALTAAFLFMDFQAVDSNTAADSQVSSFRIGLEQGEPPAPFPTLALYSQKESIFQETFGQSLESKLYSIPGLNQVEILSEAVDQDDNPMFIIEFEKIDITWTPIYGRAEIEVAIAFATDGDVSFRHRTPVHFDDGDSPSLKISGDLQIQDETRGLMSRVAYHKHLQEIVSQAITDILVAQLSH